MLSILPQSKVENREDKSLFLKGERSPEGTKSKCRSKGTIQHILTDFLGKRIRVSWPLFIFLLQGHQLIPNSGTCWLGKVVTLHSGKYGVGSVGPGLLHQHRHKRGDLAILLLSPKNCPQSCSTNLPLETGRHNFYLHRDCRSQSPGFLARPAIEPPHGPYWVLISDSEPLLKWSLRCVQDLYLSRH